MAAFCGRTNQRTAGRTELWARLPFFRTEYGRELFAPSVELPTPAMRKRQRQSLRPVCRVPIIPEIFRSTRGERVVCKELFGSSCERASRKNCESYWGNSVRKRRNSKQKVDARYLMRGLLHDASRWLRSPSNCYQSACADANSSTDSYRDSSAFSQAAYIDRSFSVDPISSLWAIHGTRYCVMVRRTIQRPSHLGWRDL